MPAQTRLAFLGGKVFTADDKNTITSGVYVEDNRISAVGPAEEISRQLPQDTKVIDIEGKTLIPGFMDAHNHMLLGGSTLEQADVKYPAVGSIEELASTIAQAAEDTPEGEWIKGWGMDYAKYPEGRMPTRWDIDEVSRSHPVYITHTSGHFALVNSKALEMQEIPDTIHDPKGGVFVRDDKGRLTGMLQDAAQQVLVKDTVDVGSHGPSGGIPLTMDEMLRAIDTACKEFHREGLTSIVDPQITSREMPGYIEAKRRGLLRIKTRCMYLSNHLQDVKKLGLTGMVGDEWLSVGPIKCYSDGTLIGCTAAFNEPYLNTGERGYTFWTQDELKDLLEDAHTSGLQTGTHTQGDRAMEMLIQSYEEILKDHPREDHRHRIEHAGYPTPSQLERIARLGIIPISQPHYIYANGAGFLSSLGEERAAGLIPLRSELDLGMPIVLSTDWSVVTFRPLDNIATAVSRITMEGQDCGKAERITVEEAIRGYTINAAYSAFQEKEKGSIEVGKAADLAVIDGDILSSRGEEIRNMSVEMTVLDGEIVYEAE